jgi:hypothetical protein
LKASTEKLGFYRVIWDGKDDEGNRVSNGVFFYCLDAGEFTATRKMVKAE